MPISRLPNDASIMKDSIGAVHPAQQGWWRHSTGHLRLHRLEGYILIVNRRCCCSSLPPRRRLAPEARPWQCSQGWLRRRRFSSKMLEWPAGSRTSDGVWAKHWYQNLIQTTQFGLQQSRIKSDQPKMEEECLVILEKALEIYNELLEYAL